MLYKYLGLNMAHFTRGWWLETNQVHFYAYFPLTFLGPGPWVCLYLQSLHWPDIGMCCCWSPSPPWSRCLVKSVQINFMILTVPKCQATHGIMPLTVHHQTPFLPFVMIILKRVLSCNSYKANEMWWMGDNEQGEPSWEHLWSLFHDPNTFFIWPISCVATFTRWFTKVSQQCCKLNWIDLITKFNLPSQSNLGKT